MNPIAQPCDLLSALVEMSRSLTASLKGTFRQKKLSMCQPG